MDNIRQGTLDIKRIIGLIEEKRPQVVKHLRKRLGPKPSRKAVRTGRTFTQDQMCLQVIALLLKSLRKKKAPVEKELEPLIRAIRQEGYSVLDFFTFLSKLTDIIERLLSESKEINKAEAWEAMSLIRKRIAELLKEVLSATSAIYERIVESGGRGWCLLDNMGTIVTVNQEMQRLLGFDVIEGKKLDSFFEGEEKRFVQAAVSGRLGDKPATRRLQLSSGSGKRVAVGTEIGYLRINGVRRGAYACMVDLSFPAIAEMQMYEASPLGIVKLNLNREFTFANQRALEICGLDTWYGKTVRDIIPDKRNFAKLKREMSKRRKGFGSEYELEITRPKDGTRVPVMITAMPEYDLRKKVVGSMAIVRPLALEKTTEAIRKHIDNIPNSREMLKAVAIEMHKVIPFDLFSVAVYTPDMTHVRGLFSYYPLREPGTQPLRRWWKMSPAMVKWSREKGLYNGRLDELLAKEEWRDLNEEADIKRLLKADLRSMVRYPIFREGKVIASLVLFRQGDKGFDEAEVELLQGLPMDKAVLAALSFEDKADLEFRLQLIQDLVAASGNLQNVAEILTDAIGRHCNWKDVALFRVDERSQVFRLLHQRPGCEDHSLPEDYEQQISEGILGYAYKTGKAVNIGDLQADSRFKSIYKFPPYAGSPRPSISELCLPIKMDGKTTWILNVEDDTKDAFSEKEKEDLESILNEVGAILQLSWLHGLLNAISKSATDAVLITDSKGSVTDVNRAFEKLMGCNKKEMLNRRFSEYFKNPDLAEYILQKDVVPDHEVTLLCKTGTEANVLLSAIRLPQELGGTVFIAKDLSLQKRVEELDYLGKMYYEIAVQTKTPLSLLFSWLSSMEKEIITNPALKNSGVASTLDKAIRQLRKLEIAYDRIALYDKDRGAAPYNELLLDIREVVNNVINELPQSELKKIDLRMELGGLDLRGDLFQLSFCFSTILSYLLRMASEERKIRFIVTTEGSWIKTEIDGSFPQPSVETNGPISRVLTEMALGERVLREFIEKNHRGRYVKESVASNVSFRIYLPASPGGGTV